MIFLIVLLLSIPCVSKPSIETFYPGETAWTIIGKTGYKPCTVLQNLGNKVVVKKPTIYSPSLSFNDPLLIDTVLTRKCFHIDPRLIPEKEPGFLEELSGFVFPLIILTAFSPVGWGIGILCIIGIIIAVIKGTHKVATKDYKKVKNKREKFLSQLSKIE